MPALLIETAYLTNKEDHKRLESNEFRNAMAEGMYDGIIEILKTMGAYKKNETWCISVED
jgi:N-acetylmuramoyl-L-alanine amidase